MSTFALTRKQAERAVKAVEQALAAGYKPPRTAGSGIGAIAAAALKVLKIPVTTLQSRLVAAKERFGLEPDLSLWAAPVSHTVEAGEVLESPLVAPPVPMPPRRQQEPAFISGASLYPSRKDNTYVFGVVSDTHLGSKYERLDVLEDLYTQFSAAGVDRVYHAGNWVEGEAPFNYHELLVHGMDAQLQYLAKHYPYRTDIHTYAVSGDDHEGWWAQKTGVNIGAYAESVMRNDRGRLDWHDLGYMEAHVRLQNANTSAEAIMSVVHPGGGSAYALSYAIQKAIESLEGGEKPAVAIYGHYHKLWAGNIRNVWVLSAGCTKDQDSFMRKKRIEAHIAGTIVTLQQDPESGAITGFLPNMKRYFNRGFYSHRWSHSGNVTLPPRS